MRSTHTDASVHMAPVHVWETIPGVILTQETAVTLGRTFSSLRDAAKCSQHLHTESHPQKQGMKQRFPHNLANI